MTARISRTFTESSFLKAFSYKSVRLDKSQELEEFDSTSWFCEADKVFTGFYRQLPVVK